MSSVKIENSTLSLYIDDIEKKNRGPIKDTKCRSRLRKRKKKEKRHLALYTITYDTIDRL